MRELQAVIGREAREQILEAEGRLPEVAVACVGGGSNAIGLFAGVPRRRRGAARRRRGARTRRASAPDGPASCTAPAPRSSPTRTARSSTRTRSPAGLDYPGVGPEHAFLRDSGRAEYVTATDEEALAAFERLARTEGIIPALEPAHALARAAELDAELVLVCLSGRGDKDLGRA